jgi:flagellar assembly protein FliH
MDTAKKFDFINSFDVSQNGVVAARDYTIEDVESAHRKGFEEGKIEGINEETASTERMAALAQESIGNALTALGGGLEDVRVAIESQAVDTVLAVVRKLVPHYTRTNALDEIGGLVQECLSAVYEEPRVVVRAHETMLDPIKDRIDDIVATSGFTGKVVLFADKSLNPEDCRVEWADGGVERDVGRLWREVEQTIARFTGTTEAGNSADPDTNVDVNVDADAASYANADTTASGLTDGAASTPTPNPGQTPGTPEEG